MCYYGGEINIFVNRKLYNIIRYPKYCISKIKLRSRSLHNFNIHIYDKEVSMDVILKLPEMYNKIIINTEETFKVKTNP